MLQTDDPDALVQFYCYSPTLNTCAAVVDHRQMGDKIGRESYIYDLLTSQVIAWSGTPDSSHAMWFLNVRTSLGNECLVSRDRVDKLAGPVGKFFADQQQKTGK